MTKPEIKPDFVPADKVEAKNIKQKVKLFFSGIDVTGYKKCPQCGGYNRRSKTKFLSYSDKYCRGCGAKMW